MGSEMQDPPMKYLALPDDEMMKIRSAPFDQKTVCWVPTALTDPLGYVIGNIKNVEGDKITVEVNGETKTLKKDECDQVNPPKYEMCTDMSNLTFLNEGSVLHNLRARYKAGLIYTYSGLFCIAVNPYRRLPIYLDEVVTMYRGKRRPEMPPHIFSIVDNAYQDMLIDHEHQSMLITGESGAGKTENTKKVIQYIAKVAGVEKSDAPKATDGVARIEGTLDEQVVQANPLLEAFGNAKTTRNNNSSRFGKFIRCHFSQTGKLAGADIEAYLLEKNRVTHQGSQERNYHIFYQILYAATDEELAGLCLLSRESANYGFLSKGVSHVDRMDDHEEYRLTTDAIKVLGFTEEEHLLMWKLTAAVLNFSCMKFKQKPRDEQAEVVDPSDGERVAYLTSIPVGEFHKSLCKPKVKVGSEYVNKGQNVDQVLYAISALSKSMFERLFWWIVERVNKALDTKQRRSYYIGVLDIAGFEIFDYNSFDQLCINFTNEKLQQFFNHHMFVLEQEEYKKEGIVWEFIDFGMDLEETINLIEKPGGILAMLEEECIVPKATDQTYLQKMHKEHAGKSKAYQKPTPKQSKQGMGDFILHHYAGSVGYSVAGWLEKNKDPINAHTAGLFSKAGNSLLSHLFQDYDPDKAGKRKGSSFQTVSFRHKEQLKGLMTTLMSTSPHFVRCIIPNENKAAGEIDGQLTLHQLRCNGVLEGIRICRKGFPSRMLFSDFRQRYQILAASAIPAGFVDGKVAAEKLMEALQMDASEFRIGLTKVFFKAGIVGELEEMRDERLSKIISQFQAYCKAHLQRIEFKKMKDRVVGLAVIQRNVRKFLYIRNWPWWKLYLLVQPMLSIVRAEDEMREKEEELKRAMEEAEENQRKRKELEENVTTMMAEKEKLFNELRQESDRLVEIEEKFTAIQTEKEQLEFQLNEAMDKLDGEAHSSSLFQERYNKAQKEIEEANNKGEELKDNISKLENEKTSLGKQIDSLNEEISRQEEAHAKVSKEKAAVEANLEERSQQLAETEGTLSKTKKELQKTEATLKDTEFNLEKEKESKAKLDKEKKRVEADLKDNKEKLAATEDDLKASKDAGLKKDRAIKELEEVKEANENTIKLLQKKISELLARIEELEEELEAEQAAKQKVEMARKDLESQLEQLNEDLVSSGDATTAQIEVTKKKEGEMAKLRTEMEEAGQAAEDLLNATKNKHATALAEVQEEMENVRKEKQKSDKAKSAVAAELVDAQAEIEKLKKLNADGVKKARGLEEQLNESKGKVEELEGQLNDANAKAAKNAGETASTAKLVEEAEHNLALSKKAFKNLENQLAESKEETEAESKAKHDFSLKLRNAQGEIEALTAQFEEESDAKAQLAAKLQKVMAEGTKGPAGMTEDDVARMGELEDAKRKLSSLVAELEEGLGAAENKLASAEKAKKSLGDEIGDLQLEVEKQQANAANSEKKAKKADASISEWKLKVTELEGKVDAAENSVRSATAEALKQRNLAADLEERVEALRKENKNLAADLKGAQEALGDGTGKSAAEVEKITRKLTAENEEVAAALEEAEVALEAESAKLVKITLEYGAFKAAAERKAADKDADFETSRRNHQRQLESLKATVEEGEKAKADLLKNSKATAAAVTKLEGELDAATRAAAEAQKNVKKLTSQAKDLTLAIEEETIGRNAAKASAAAAEKRANELALLVDEGGLAVEQSERARKMAEAAAADAADRLAEVEGLYNAVADGKRKAENDYFALQDELESLGDAAAAADGKVAKAQAEVARVEADLLAARDATATAEASKTLLGIQISELQGALAEAEAASGRGLKQEVRKLELRVLELESDVDSEGRKSLVSAKQARQAEKKVKDLESSLEAEKKSAAATAADVAKLQGVVRALRLSLEEAQMKNNALATKNSKALAELEESESRCAAAEVALQKARQKVKAASGLPSRSRTPAGGD